MSDSTVRAELTAALVGWGIQPERAAADGTSLISSGALDSLALFQLSMWVEEMVGRPVDPSGFDLVAEWDTPAGIAHFVETARNGAPNP